MNSGHVVGYVGGLAVALGVGGALWLSTPTASADTGTGSPHSASPGTAKSARPDRANPVAARKPAPATSRRLRGAAAAPETLSDNSIHKLNVGYEYDQDTGKTTTLVTVVDAGTGAQIGGTVTLDGSTAKSPVVSVDGSHAFVATTYNNTDNKPTTLVAEIDTTTGTQVGPTLSLIGTLSNLSLSAQDTRAVVTTTWNTSDTGDILDTGGTVIAIIDSATGLNMANTYFFDGVVSNVVPSADGRHILINSSHNWVPGYPGTTAVVLDTITGATTGPVMKFRGDSTWTPPLMLSDDGSKALIMTNNAGVGTVVRVVDTTTGYLIGSEVNLLGYANGPAIMTGDHIHVLINGLSYNSDNGNAVLSVIDTATGSQTGNSLWVHGSPVGSPLLMPDGKHAVIVTTVKDSDNVSTKTAVAVLDTTTGTQVGKTLSLMGGVSGSHPPTVGPHGVVVRTTAGLQTTVNPITGATRTVPVAYPWGFDLEAVSRAIGRNPLYQAVGGFLFSTGFVGVLALGVVLSYAIAIANQIVQQLGLPPIAAATPW